jgi:hypothetical protein
MTERITSEQVAEMGKWIEGDGYNTVRPDWFYRLADQMEADEEDHQKVRFQASDALFERDELRSERDALAVKVADYAEVLNESEARFDKVVDNLLAKVAELREAWVEARAWHLFDAQGDNAAHWTLLPDAQREKYRERARLDAKTVLDGTPEHPIDKEDTHDPC